MNNNNHNFVNMLRSKPLLLLIVLSIAIVFCLLALSVLSIAYAFLLQLLGIPSNETSYIDLASSLLLVLITIFYVAFTYNIMSSTEKNTAQAANSQRITFCERRLELFYLPLKSALERFDVNRIVELNSEIESAISQEKHYSIEQVDNIWWRFKEDYNKIIPYTYLALNEEDIHLTEFTNMFELNHMFDTNFINIRSGQNKDYDKITDLINRGCLNKYLKDSEAINQVHTKIQNSIARDIKLIKAELKELLNN
ncbi:MAG: hypothetical protein A4E23_00983 [Methanomethylovorans sp. PtaU1.Bin073]|nr:MAG: hypothetical protein A4E23_00983 [Methanomethylovorans sp. PtaU1.Bin073]